MEKISRNKASKEETRISKIISMLDMNKSFSSSGHNAILSVPERDDCAVIPISQEHDLVVGTDFIRGSGFYLFQEKILNWFDIGYYLVGANASDLAAMGAKPTGFFSIIRYTPKIEDYEFEEIVNGITTACKDFEMPLLGGDTGGYNEVVLSGTAIGICKKNAFLRRDGGKSGDQLFITGSVGLAAAALAYFTKLKKNGSFHLSPSKEQELAISWKRVKPALKQAQFLVNKKYSCCAIDTSDGLKASLRQIAKASSLDAVVDLEKVPIDDLTASIASAMKVNPFGLAIGDSVDFRLLFSTPKNKVDEMLEGIKKQGWDVCHIGEFRDPVGEPGAWQNIENNLKILPGVEWDQSETPTIERLLVIEKKQNG